MVGLEFDPGLQLAVVSFQSCSIVTGMDDKIDCDELG